jgi:hypothetical protein
MRPTDYARLISYAALAISNEWQPACANALSRRVRLLAPAWPLTALAGLWSGRASASRTRPCPPAGFEAAC